MCAVAIFQDLIYMLVCEMFFFAFLIHTFLFVWSCVSESGNTESHATYAEWLKFAL